MVRKAPDRRCPPAAWHVLRRGSNFSAFQLQNYAVRSKKRVTTPRTTFVSSNAERSKPAEFRNGQKLPDALNALPCSRSGRPRTSVESVLCQSRALEYLRDAPLDDARLGIGKYFTSLRCPPSIAVSIRLAEPIGQRLSA